MSLSKAQADLAAWENRAKSLRAELAAAEDRVAKIRIYLEMAQAYGGGVENVSAGQPPIAIAKGPSKSVGRPPGGKRVLMEAPVKAMLRERASRMRTPEILEKLSAAGFEIGGESPINNLSGILSRMNGVNNDRLLGWGLDEWLSQSTPASDNGAISASALPPHPSLFQPDAQE